MCTSNLVSVWHADQWGGRRAGAGAAADAAHYGHAGLCLLAFVDAF